METVASEFIAECLNSFALNQLKLSGEPTLDAADTVVNSSSKFIEDLITENDVFYQDPICEFQIRAVKFFSNSPARIKFFYRQKVPTSRNDKAFFCVLTQ